MSHLAKSLTLESHLHGPSYPGSYLSVVQLFQRPDYPKFPLFRSFTYSEFNLSSILYSFCITCCYNL